MAFDDWSISFNGFRIGGADPNVDFIVVEGVEDLPDIESGDIPLGRSHGLLTGPQFARGRTITVTADIALTPEPQFRAVIDAMNAATALRQDERPLSWRFGSAPEKMVMARCRRRNVAVDVAFALNHARATLQFVATDPRIYGTTEHSGTTGTASVTGGLGFPHGFPHGFGSATPGTIQVVNEGHVPAPWTATLTGPLSGPRISLVGTVGVLAFDGFDLPAGQTLEIDSRARTILLNGQSSRYGSASLIRWFDLPVGTSRIQLSAAAGSGSLTLRYRSTYL